MRHGFPPYAHDRIEIAKQDDACLRAHVAYLSAHAEDIAKPRAACDCTLAGPLDDRAVGKRVAERHAELDDVRACINGGHRHVARSGKVGVTGGEVDDEAGFVWKHQWHVFTLFS